MKYTEHKTELKKATQPTIQTNKQTRKPFVSPRAHNSQSHSVPVTRVIPIRSQG